MYDLDYDYYEEEKEEQDPMDAYEDWRLDKLTFENN